jgi:hypothetical protein
MTERCGTCASATDRIVELEHDLAVCMDVSETRRKGIDAAVRLHSEALDRIAALEADLVSQRKRDDNLHEAAGVNIGRLLEKVGKLEADLAAARAENRRLIDAQSILAGERNMLVPKEDLDVVFAAGVERGKASYRWQPIETAPKDGTWVLVYDPSIIKPSHRVQVAHYDADAALWMDQFNCAVDSPVWAPMPERRLPTGPRL